MDTDQPPPHGRPRNATVDETILRATVGLIATFGLHDATTAEIAARAGVGKDTIYRRWPTKLDLVLAALDHAAGELPPIPTSDALGPDLRDHLVALSRVLHASPLGAAVAALVGEGPREPRIAAWLAAFWRRWIDALDRRLAEADDHGELVMGFGGSHLAELVVGSVAGRWLFRAPPFSAREITGLVETLLEGRLDVPADW